jgi:hypothetical protein
MLSKCAFSYVYYVVKCILNQNVRTVFKLSMVKEKE